MSFAFLPSMNIPVRQNKDAVFGKCLTGTYFAGPRRSREEDSSAFQFRDANSPVLFNNLVEGRWLPRERGRLLAVL